LMLTNGSAQEVFQRSLCTEPPVVQTYENFGTPTRFVSQRTIAIRRLRVIAAILAGGAIAAATAIAR